MVDTHPLTLIHIWVVTKTRKGTDYLVLLFSGFHPEAILYSAVLALTQIQTFTENNRAFYSMQFQSVTNHSCVCGAYTHVKHQFSPNIHTVHLYKLTHSSKHSLNNYALYK